jgi:hypothetical protein
VKFLAQPYFIEFVVPLIAVGLSIFLKFVTRNDKYKGFRKEDLAVGLDLSVSSLLVFITSSAQLAVQIQSTPDPTKSDVLAGTPWMIAAFFIGLWGVSTTVRKLGWEDDEKLHLWWGIVLPNVFGFILLLIVVNWIS